MAKHSSRQAAILGEALRLISGRKKMDSPYKNKNPSPNQNGTRQYETVVGGHIDVTGIIQTELRPSVQQTQDAREEKRDAEDEKRDKRDIRRLVIEKWTLIFVIAYAAVAALQLIVSQHAVDVARDASKNQLSAYSFIEQINIVGGGGDTQYDLDMHLSNSGETPARGVKITNIGMYRIPIYPVIVTSIGRDRPNQTDIFIGTIPPKGGRQALTNIGRDIVDEIRNKSTSLLVFGDINYRDIFGREHVTQFCQSFQAIIVKGGPTGPTGPEDFEFGACQVHNCDDDDCPAK